jgi:hypothetical protein
VCLRNPPLIAPDSQTRSLCVMQGGQPLLDKEGRQVTGLCVPEAVSSVLPEKVIRQKFCKELLAACILIEADRSTPNSDGFDRLNVPSCSGRPPVRTRPNYFWRQCANFLQCFSSSGTLPPFSASLAITCLCSQTFIVAESSVLPV